MKIIGLTGGTGSGKGEVSKILKDKGAFIVDADAISHDIILSGKKAYKELVDYFGIEILGENKEIVRKNLGKIVFEDGKEKLDFLNKCTHKYIYEEMSEQIEKYKEDGAKIIILDAPLLLEGNFRDLCSLICVVFADEKIRLERIMKRDSISIDHARNRISSQKTWQEYKAYADFVIDNSRDIDSLEKQINEFLEKL